MATPDSIQPPPHAPRPEAPDRLMAVVGPDPDAEFLIRTAARVAGPDAAWLAVYVDTGRVFSESERLQLEAGMDLARSLGADVITTAGADFVDAILRVAEQENVTRLVLDKSLRGPWWQRWSGRSPLDRLVRQSGDIDTHLVTPRRPSSQRRSLLPPAPRGWREWVLAAVMGACMTVLGRVVEMNVGYPSVPPVYLVILLVSSLFMSRWPLMLLAFGSTMAWWFFILPQRFSLRIHRLEDGLMLALFFIAALASGHLAALLRSRERGGVEGELAARTLYNLLRELNSVCDLDNRGIESALAGVETVFGARISLLLPGGDGVSPVTGRAGGAGLPAAELAAAGAARRTGRWTGRGTPLHPDASAIYVPMAAAGHVRGVLAVQPRSKAPWTVLQHELMESIAQLLARVLEREDTARQARSAAIAIESQKMQRALVDNFSHEMHTPIAVLSSAIQHLRRQDPPGRGQDVLTEAAIAVDRLKLVVTEMADLAQIECGTLRPTLEWCDTADYLREWLEDHTAGFPDRRIDLILPDRTVYIRVDTRLLNTALGNILHNALRHAPAGTAVSVEAVVRDPWLLIRIGDRGAGIPPELKDRLFERFVRGPGEPAGGLGLGLAIARQFVELIGGSVEAGSAPGGGARFTLFLPCALDLPLAKDANP